jgi:protein TonB
MFDSVGRNIDDEALKRQAQSVGIATLLVGVIAGALFVKTLYTIKEMVAPTPVDAEIVEVELPEDPGLEAPPPPPPPPPSAGAQDESQDETTPSPDEMQDPQELKPEIKDEVKSDVKPAGVEGGVVGGVAGGVVGGVNGGVVGGVLGGQLGGDGVKVVHQSKIEWKKLVKPEYPKAALGLGLGDQSCKAIITLSAEGVPTKVTVDGCPQIFFDGTREALLSSRTYPYKDNGIKAAVQTVVLIKYVLPGGG